MNSPFKFIARWWTQYRAKVGAKALGDDLKEYVQMLYRLGYETDEITENIINEIKSSNDSSPEINLLLRNMRRLVASYHPTTPLNFEGIP